VKKPVGHTFPLLALGRTIPVAAKRLQSTAQGCRAAAACDGHRFKTARTPKGFHRRLCDPVGVEDGFAGRIPGVALRGGAASLTPGYRMRRLRHGRQSCRASFRPPCGGPLVHRTCVDTNGLCQCWTCGVRRGRTPAEPATQRSAAIPAWGLCASVRTLARGTRSAFVRWPGGTRGPGIGDT
jgi:hypothetical protein